MTSFKTRTCVSCRKKDNQDNLLRITKCENDYVINVLNSLQGRSIYIHNDKKCISKLLKMKKRYDFNNITVQKINELLEKCE